jgi:uridine kinase
MKLTINCPDGQTIEKEYEGSITLDKVMESLSFSYPIYACKVNNHFERLNTKIYDDALIEFYDIRNQYANMCYQNSLTLLYLKAIKDISGDDTTIHMANSISKGVFTTIYHSKYDREELVEKVKARMLRLVDADLPILQVKKSRDELLHDFNKNHSFPYESKVIQTAYDVKEAYVCTLDDTQHLFYQYLLPSTKYLNLFDLHVYRKGIVLQFPQPSSPNIVPKFKKQNLLYEAFSEEKSWEKLMGVREVSTLNEKILNEDYKDMILLSEALHEKKIADIARRIHDEKKRIVLIAGPSSSGKTSFAKRLCIQLQVIGLKPLYLGTDDYFINRADLPVQEDGTKDFESLSAVDVELFTKQMNDLLEHKTVDLPEYDFVKGEKIYGKRIITLSDDQIIVIEGIHGLNPELTKGIKDKEKFKIYISPLTQLTIDRYHRIPTTDARMLRRLVRDYRTRNVSAEETIESWHLVRKGEEKNIFPYNGEADVFFNSQCVYELSVLKKYAEPLLKKITYESPQYTEAQRMLKFLDFFVPIQDDSCIANNSIIREFIGGSIIAS